MDIYAQNIMDHYRNPRNKGVIENPIVHHEEANISCGDVLDVYLLIEDDEINDIKFTGSGCAISQASLSIFSEWVIGRSVAEVEAVDKEKLFGMLGVEISFRRTKCALLGLLAIKNALRKFRNEKYLAWFDIAGEV